MRLAVVAAPRRCPHFCPQLCSHVSCSRRIPRGHFSSRPLTTAFRPPGLRVVRFRSPTRISPPFYPWCQRTRSCPQHDGWPFSARSSCTRRRRWGLSSRAGGGLGRDSGKGHGGGVDNYNRVVSGRHRGDCRARCARRVAHNFKIASSTDVERYLGRCYRPRSTSSRDYTLRRTGGS